MDFVIDLYQQRVPLIVLQTEIVNRLSNWPSVQTQEQLLEGFHLSCDSYPPLKRWQHKLLKWMISQTESLGIDLCDQLVNDALLAAAAAKDCFDENDPDYKVYHYSLFGAEVGTQKLTIIRQIQLHNQVGMKIWPASLFLFQFLHCVPHLTRNKRVLELGSGTGIVGLLVAMTARTRPATLLLTDFESEVIDNLKFNVEQNSLLPACRDDSNDSNGGNGGNGGCNNLEIGVSFLDWSVADPLQQHHDSTGRVFDVLIAADCVYSEELNVDLVNALRSYLLLPSHAHTFIPPASSIAQQVRPQHSLPSPGDTSLCSRPIPIPTDDLHVSVVVPAPTLTSCVSADSSASASALLMRHMPKALLGSSIRNMATYTHFLSLLDSHCDVIAYTDLTAYANDQFVTTTLSASGAASNLYLEDRSTFKLIVVFPAAAPALAAALEPHE